jgi:hypothetical protein
VSVPSYTTPGGTGTVGCYVASGTFKVKIKNYKEQPDHWDNDGIMMSLYSGQTVTAETLEEGSHHKERGYIFRVADRSRGRWWYLKPQDIESSDAWISNLQSMFRRI